MVGVMVTVPFAEQEVGRNRTRGEPVELRRIRGLRPAARRGVFQG
jgi:hypothetical protein